LMPQANMQPIGYLCQQHSVRLDRPVKAYDKWVNRIPSFYREFVLKESTIPNIKPQNDPYCLATIKHFRSLIPMGQESRKPIFNLTSADGAIGSHANAVQDAKKDFKTLAELIADKIGLQLT
jgi:chromosome partitioning protein